jgi:hypothetical protein
LDDNIVYLRHKKLSNSTKGKKMNDLYFEFLDDLKDSGTMNMMGAPRELQNEFGLNKIQARSVFQLWCLNLGEVK